MSKHGGRLVALAVDTPAQSRDVVTSQHLPFSILSDVDRKTIHAYGVVHEHGGPQNEDVAIPAMFLVERSGKIVWSRVAKRVMDRPSPEDVIAAIRAHLPG